MFRRLSDYFESKLLAAAGTHTGAAAAHALQLATATLLVEMTRADFAVQAIERESVLTALQRAFGLSGTELQELAQLAEQSADQATSLHQFTDLMNRQYSPEQKVEVVALLWRVAVADGHIDKYEDYLVRKLADLLYVSHRDFIRSKHKVLAETPGTR